MATTSTDMKPMITTMPMETFLCRQHLTLQTRELQYEFDEIMKMIRKLDLKCCARLLPPKTTKAAMHLLLNHHISWFNYDILHFIVNENKDDASDCKTRLVEYDQKVKLYFQQRTKEQRKETSALLQMESHEIHKPLNWVNNNNKKVELLVLNIDRAWDMHVLEGENCNKTCQKIASILGRSGCVSGYYDEPSLCISISR